MKKSLMVALAVILALIVGATGVFAAGDGCFTDADGEDADGDGVCDNRGTGTGGGGHHGNGNGCR